MAQKLQKNSKDDQAGLSRAHQSHVRRGPKNQKPTTKNRLTRVMSAEDQKREA